MKIKIELKERTSNSPGIWLDSTLKVFIEGDKYEVRRILEEIKTVIGDSDV